MNAKEAKKILAEGTDWDKNQWAAEGYLEAYAKAEKLVKALEDILQYPEIKIFMGTILSDKAKAAVEDWRLENGLVKPSPEK